MRTRKRLKKIEDIRRFLADTINQYAGNKIDTDQMRCYAYSCSVLCGIVKDSELESRLEKLEKTLEGDT